jgi:hypothetical protein
MEESIRRGSAMLLAALFLLPVGCNSSSKNEDASDARDTPDDERTDDAVDRDDGPDRDPVEGTDPEAIPDGGDSAEDPGAPEDGPPPDDANDPEGEPPAEDLADPLDSPVDTEITEVEEAEDISDGEIFDPYPAPNFTLVDSNPSSSTYHDVRTLSGVRGKVIILFFISFG